MATVHEKMEEAINTYLCMERGAPLSRRQRRLIAQSSAVASAACFFVWPGFDVFVVPTPKTPASHRMFGTRASSSTVGALRVPAMAAASADMPISGNEDALSQPPRGLFAAARANIAVLASSAAGVAIVLRRRSRRQAVGRQSTAATLTTTVPNMALAFSAKPVDTCELFNCFMKRTTTAGKCLAKLPLPMSLMSRYTTLPLVAALGAVLCPSESMLARALAVALGSLLGSAASNALEHGKQEAARCTVLSVLAQHMNTQTTAEEMAALVENARQQYAVASGHQRGEAFEESALQDIYASLLTAILDQQDHCAEDFPMLQRLKTALKLDDIVVGYAHKRAAQVLVSKGYFGLDSDELRTAVDKLLFLSERVFSDIVPDEARLYEMSQLRKVLRISPQEAKERIATISRALYQEQLSGVVDQVDAHTAEVLAAASTTFGLGDEDTAQMNAATYQRIASELLEQGSMDDAAWSTLSRARNVLMLGERAATEAFNNVAGPLLRQDVMSVARDINNSAAAAPEVIASALSTKAKSLGLEVDAADAVVVSAFTDAMRALYSEACRDVLSSDGDQDAALALSDNLLAFTVSADAVLAAMRTASADVAAVGEPLSIAADGLRASRLYALHLARELAGAAPGATPAAELARILELSGEDEEAARIEVAQPHLEKMYLESVEKAASGAAPIGMAKMAIEAELNKLNLPFEAVEETAMAVYKQRLAAIGERVLSKAEKDQLDSELKFLDLSVADVRRLHLKAFGGVYEKSVDESMGRGGIMMPEAKEGLTQLRERLGVHADDAEKVFNGVVEKRLRGYFGGVKAAWEEATYSPEALTQLYKERGQDNGHDPSADGTGNAMALTAEQPLEGIRGYKFMVEATRVAEFYIGNGVFADGAMPGADDAYPVTVGKFLEDTAKEEMYGIYAWNAVTCQDSGMREKWGRFKPHVGGILGLGSDKQKKVMERMVSRWANMFIKNQIEQQGKLQDSDITTLTEWVPTFFGIDKEATQRLVKTANKGMLQSKVLKLLNQQKITPSDVHSLRDDVETWDLRLEKDFELTRPQLRSLFRVEIMSSLEDPDKSEDEKRDAVESAREAFGLDHEDALSELGSCLRTRCKGYLVNAVGDLIQGHTKEAVKQMQHLELLSSFADLADGVDLDQDWDVAPAMRRQLVQTYCTSAVAGQHGKQPNVDLLERVLGLVQA